mgnify:CR=1 FL=1
MRSCVCGKMEPIAWPTYIRGRLRYGNPVPRHISYDTGTMTIEPRWRRPPGEHAERTANSVPAAAAIGAGISTGI